MCSLDFKEKECYVVHIKELFLYKKNIRKQTLGRLARQLDYGIYDKTMMRYHT